MSKCVHGSPSDSAVRIDLSGVLEGFSGESCAVYNERYGQNESGTSPTPRADRQIPADALHPTQRLSCEIYIWHQLDHHNIARLYGTFKESNGFPSMVTPYYERGNVWGFLGKNPQYNRVKLVSGISQLDV